MYKRMIRKHGHALANSHGDIRFSRYLLFEDRNGVAGVCFWCNCELTWKTLCADHLDSDNSNDVIGNLVASCRGCNANREDGTGHGRKQPKKCKDCGMLFVCKHQNTQVYCSEECARKNRPKRGTKALHGTRSRYMFGCRCNECKKSNSLYWNIWNKKNASKHCWSK